MWSGRGEEGGIVVEEEAGRGRDVRGKAYIQVGVRAAEWWWKESAALACQHVSF
jgi:hypothetical protein